jgi:hypothetical protein
MTNSTSTKSDTEVLAGFIASRPDDGYELRARFDHRLLARVGPLPAALAGLALEEDVLQRTWELVFRAGSSGYEPKRGTVIAYLEGHARNAKRDVCAAHAPPGSTTRPGKGPDGLERPSRTPLSIEQILPGIEGDGAALDTVLADPEDGVSRALDRLYADELAAAAARSSTLHVAGLIATMREDRDLGEASSALGISRFAARRALDRFAAGLAAAA